MLRHLHLTLLIAGLTSVGSSRLFAADKLRVGDQAPDFSLPCATRAEVSSQQVRLSEEVGHSAIVLAFYPADWSGGCTKEMCTLRDNYNSLSELGAKVYGISGDYVYSHREWAKHLDLQFALLSDHNHSVAEAYGSFDQLTGYNKRTVFVINRGGTISYIDPAYNVGSPDSFERLKRALKEIQPASVNPR